MKKWITEHWSITIAIVIFICGFILFVPCIRDTFFGRSVSPSEIITYIGIAAGSIIVIGQLIAAEKRNNLMKTRNELTEKANLDIRFKDAAMLLANDNTSAMLSGVAALHQIAVEASQIEDQQDYVQVIKDILINFIREGSQIEYKKDAQGNVVKDTYEEPMVEKAYNDKPTIIVQTIIDKLFKDKYWAIYKDYPTDLSNCVLKGFNLDVAHLEEAYFWGAHLERADFRRAHLEGADFRRAHLEEAKFRKAFVKRETIFTATIYTDLPYEKLLERLGAKDSEKVMK
ncbi:MAG: pentapeptide repeat-containing protein [Bacteroidales bacterium]|jgi:hypothetical protein|nr:pentapeptide repeat-containing protein [Bacteroidales bacterium]